MHCRQKLGTNPCIAAKKLCKLIVDWNLFLVQKMAPHITYGKKWPSYDKCIHEPCNAVKEPFLAAKRKRTKNLKRNPPLSCPENRP